VDENASDGVKEYWGKKAKMFSPKFGAPSKVELTHRRMKGGGPLRKNRVRCVVALPTLNGFLGVRLGEAKDGRGGVDPVESVLE